MARIAFTDGIEAFSTRSGTMKKTDKSLKCGFVTRDAEMSHLVESRE